MIRIGPAGWSYRDWVGTVYPKQPRVDQLGYLSGFFDLIEINSTFYGPPAARSAESWVRRTQHNPDFRFTVKLWREMTHERGRIEDKDLGVWREGILPLKEAGRIGAILIQFPWSFKNEHDSRQYLVRLLEKMAGDPLVVEFRHESWNQDEVLALLDHAGAGICNIDQPVIGKSIRPQSHVTCGIGYLRCHGRNYRDWFREGARRDARYNYLYTPEELGEQVGLVQSLQSKSREVYAVYNNHYRGQAVVNALQLRREVEGALKKVPEPLMALYREQLA